MPTRHGLLAGVSGSPCLAMRMAPTTGGVWAQETNPRGAAIDLVHVQLNAQARALGQDRCRFGPQLQSSTDQIALMIKRADEVGRVAPGRRPSGRRLQPPWRDGQSRHLPRCPRAYLRRPLGRLQSRWLPFRLIPHRHRPGGELQPAYELQVDILLDSPCQQRRPMAASLGCTTNS